MNFGRSFSEVAGGKRPGKPLTNSLDKMGLFKPTPAFCRMVEDNLLNRNALIARPKSHFKNGLRINFAECDPMLIKEIAAATEETFPDYTVASTKLSGGFFDIAFKTPNAADEAAKKILKAKGRLSLLSELGGLETKIFLLVSMTYPVLCLKTIY